jgi:dienelactone hydrolase
MRDNSWAPPNTQRQWEDARRTAFVQDVLSAFTRRQTDLLPFEEVRHELQLRDVRYVGLQDVPLDQIVGSVGRYQDFTRAFFPRRAVARDRWRKIARLAAAMDTSLPPVELYKVGQVYFVRDGNHRVSVARRQKSPAIQAYVWEYETRVPLTPNITPDELLRKAAYAAFLEQTGVDRFLCSDMRIELSQPDGYEELLYEIGAFQHTLSRIDERQVPFEEAVALWCEMRYTPIVEIMREGNILQEFPGRTEADLYLWLCRNQEELDTRYGQSVMIQEAAEDLAERFGDRPSPIRRVRKTAGRVMEGVGELSFVLARTMALESQAEEDRVAAALLAPIRHVAAAVPPCRFQGTTEAEWETWRAEFGARLWHLLGVGDYPWKPYGPVELAARVAERATVDGLVRELVWLHAEEELHMPAYLFRSVKAEGPRPAVVVFPGHGTIDGAAGLETSPQRANARELARCGFITLAVEARGFGRLGAVSHLQLDAAARLVGRTWYGLLVGDGMRAIDYLLTRLEVDPDRIAVAGIGEGGGTAMYLAALDGRVRAAVVSGYLGKYAIAALDEEHCPCNDIPGMLCHAEMGDVAALIAPRPVLFVNGRDDPNANPGTRESFAVARHVYQLLGVPRQARLLEPEGMGHHFDNQLAAGWLRRWLETPHDQ